jgi:hypothetical protein
MSDELKPCPFCGAAPKVESADHFFWVICACGARAKGTCDGESEAAAYWNRRAPWPKLPEPDIEYPDDDDVSIIQLVRREISNAAPVKAEITN